jgi:hypothetical protein
LKVLTEFTFQGNKELVLYDMDNGSYRRFVEIKYQSPHTHRHSVDSLLNVSEVIGVVDKDEILKEQV